MPPEMTDAERLALIQRITDRLLLDQERELNRPAWYPIAAGLGTFALGILLVVVATIVAKHIGF